MSIMYEILVSVLAIIGVFSLFYFAALIAFIRIVFFKPDLDDRDIDEELWKR